MAEPNGGVIERRLWKPAEQEADDALRYIAQPREDPTVAAFGDAAEDDEPVTAAEEQALAEVHVDRAARVPRISYAEIMREHGPR